MRTSLPGLAAVRLAVPAYAHPLADPALWVRLADAADVLRLVVVNPHDGPGRAVDPAYPPVLARLRERGVRLVGYVDTDYGRRPVAEVVADVQRHVRWYGLEGVFLDQVSSGLDRLEHYAQLVQQVRAAGARFVALNPGTHPHPGYVDLANVTVTFEGPEEDYRGLEVPAWTRRFPAARLAHLVHGVPAGRVADVLALAAERHVQAVHVTTGSGANPWDDLPGAAVAALQAARPDRPDRRPEPPQPPPGPGAAPTGAASRRAAVVAILVLADAAVLGAGAARVVPSLRSGLLLVVLGALAGVLARRRAAGPLSRRDLALTGVAYHLTGLAGLLLAPSPATAVAGLLLAAAGAPLLVPSGGHRRRPRPAAAVSPLRGSARRSGGPRAPRPGSAQPSPSP